MAQRVNKYINRRQNFVQEQNKETKLQGWLRESLGDRDQVINTAHGAHWKLCKPKGTNCGMLQWAAPAERTGRSANWRLTCTSFYSVFTGYNNKCSLDLTSFCFFSPDFDRLWKLVSFEIHQQNNKQRQTMTWESLGSQTISERKPQLLRDLKLIG